MSIFATDVNEGLPGLSFLRPIEGELRRVEEILSTELLSEVRTVDAVTRHLLEAGGKRLRPSLVIVSTLACAKDCDMDRMLHIAASAELIHMATLMHDDVIDDADSRRGRMTVNSLWSNQISVLSGDFVLAKAFFLLAREGHVEVMRVLARAAMSMAEGEIVQIETIGCAESSCASYLAVIRHKTAEFMSACCRIGPILTASSSDVEKSLAQYGLDLGTAFQITDDLLDLVGDPAQTGKPIGGDIREGKVTMPLILTMENAAPSDRSALEAILRSNDVSDADIDLARRLAADTGAVKATREVAADYVSKAIEHLSVLPASEHRDALEDLARYVLHRGS